MEMLIFIGVAVALYFIADRILDSSCRVLRFIAARAAHLS